MRARRTILTAAAAGLASLAFCAASPAAVFNVDDLDDANDLQFSTVDPHDGVCDAVGADTCTLRAAIQEANATLGAEDVVNVTLPGTINVASGALGDLSIQTDTVVNGHAGGTTLDANSSGRVMSLIGPPSTDVTLNDLTLREGAVTNEEGAGMLIFSPSLTANRVTVTANDLNSAAGGFRGAGISATNLDSAITLNDSTVSNNEIQGLAGLGGGIASRAPVTLNRSTISGNSTTFGNDGRGGGIDLAPFSAVALTIRNSTISGNTAGGLTFSGGGGGIFAASDVVTTVTNSTFAGNSTSGEGGAMRLNSPTPLVSENTIYADNTSGSAFTANCGLGVVPAATSESNIDSGNTCGFGTSNGNRENVSAAALALGSLAANGGPTQTRALGAGSVALNSASADCGGLSTDQRGVARPQGAACDIGAFELVSPGAPPPQGGGATAPPAETPAAPKRCKKGQKLKKGRCVKKKRKRKR